MNITCGKIQKPQKVVVYGPEGIGKSTFAAQFPNPIFIDTEGSTYYMDVNRFDRPSSLEMMKQQINYAVLHAGDYRTLVIDTADWAEKLCAEAICSKYKKQGIEDFGYGNGYTYLAEEFGRILNLLEDAVSAGLNVVLTAHAFLRKFEQPDEAGAYDRWELKLTKKSAPLLKEWADCLLFVNYKTVVEKTNSSYKASGGKRIMYATHHPCWDAKNRYGLPDEVEFDYSVIAPFIQNKNNIPSQVTQAVENTVNEEINNIVMDIPDIPEAIPDVPDSSISSDIPPKVAELMKSNNVTEGDIQLVVSQRGYFPIETKIKDYGEDFINGWLLPFWEKILTTIAENNDLPFD